MALSPVLAAKYNCSDSLEARFWAKVQKGPGCWEWTASKHDFGYGQIGFGYGKDNVGRAHRLSWMIHFGDVPSGMMVLHKCDNPACVNPDHLKLGTYQDNVDDMMARNRRKETSGESNANHKLTWSQVREIRSSRIRSHQELAAKYSVSKPTICQILHNKLWKDTNYAAS